MNPLYCKVRVEIAINISLVHTRLLASLNNNPLIHVLPDIGKLVGAAMLFFPLMKWPVSISVSYCSHEPAMHYL